MNNKYLKQLEKHSSLVLGGLLAAKGVSALKAAMGAGAATKAAIAAAATPHNIAIGALGGVGVHVGQNAIATGLLRSKHVSQHVANGLSYGLQGGRDKSTWTKVKQFALGGISPEIGSMRVKANELGHKFKSIHLNANPEDREAITLLMQGNLPELRARGLHRKPMVRTAASHLDHHLGTNLVAALGDGRYAKNLADHIHKNFSRADNPMMSNILANLHKGVVDPKKFATGKETGNALIAGGILGGIPDLAVTGGFGTTGAVWSAGKSALMTNEKFRNHKLIKPISDTLEEQFVHSPIRTGFREGEKGTISEKIRHHFDTLALSPSYSYLKRSGKITGDLARTSGAIPDLSRSESLGKLFRVPHLKPETGGKKMDSNTLAGLTGGGLLAGAAAGAANYATKKD